MLEHLTWRDGDRALARLCDEPQAQDRIPAQLEEIVMTADATDSQ